MSNRISARLFFARCLSPQLGLLRLEGRREILPKVSWFKNLADLDLGVLHGGAFDPIDRLLLGLHFENPVSGDEFLRFGKRTIDDGRFAVRKLDPRPLRAGVKTV